MKKFAFICAAVFALAAPTVASAQGIGVHIGDDGYRDRGEYRGDYREHRGPRVEYSEHDRGWHRGWEHRRWEHRGDRVTIIERHRHHWDD
jgi:hypothetical protein